MSYVWGHTPHSKHGQVKSETVGRGALRHFGQSVELEATDSAAEATVEFTLLEAIDSQRGCKREGTVPIPILVVDTAEVLIIKCNQGEKLLSEWFPISVCNIWCQGFKVVIKIAAKFMNICRPEVEVNIAIVNIRIERGLFKARDALGSKHQCCPREICSMCFYFIFNWEGAQSASYSVTIAVVKIRNVLVI